MSKIILKLVNIIKKTKNYADNKKLIFTHMQPCVARKKQKRIPGSNSDYKKQLRFIIKKQISVNICVFFYGVISLFIIIWGYKN